MRTIIAGSRTVKSQSVTFTAIKGCPWGVSEVVSGRAAGPDTHGERYAAEMNLPVQLFPADWGNLGQCAGIIRNEDMAKYADALVAVWDGKSSGTKHMIDCMTALGKPVHVHIHKEGSTSMKLLHHPESDDFFLGNPSGPDMDYCDEFDAQYMPSGTVISNVGLSQSTVLPSMDFETYSEAGYEVDRETKTVKGMGSGSKGGLGVVGTPVYAEHPSTEVLCLYYNMKDGFGVRAYIPGLTPEPTDLMNYIAAGGHIEAFNITFEWWIWNMVCHRRMGWPPLQLDQCHCVMARARRFSVPGSLGKLAQALGTADKDKAGANLIQKLCRPHKPTKNRPAFRRTPTTDWKDFQALYAYCGQDTVAEDNAAARLPDLTEYERSTWLADQYINARGVRVDVDSLSAALDIMQQMFQRFTLELAQITNGQVGSASEVAKMLDFLKQHRVYLPNLRSETVEEALATEGMEAITGVPRRVLEIRQALAGANIKKLPKLSMQTSSDGRLRNQYMYCGADRTGRWSSAAADDGASNSQLQNISAKGPKSKTCDHCGHIVGAHVGACPSCHGTAFTKNNDWTVDAVECALQDIRSRELQRVIDMWGDPATLLTGCLRGMFIAKEQHDFICCDFSAIEAVVLACLARCQWRIDVFNTHGKIYEMSASKISGVPFEEMMQYKKDNGFDHPLRKKLGKVAELASGYGGWLGAWKAFGAEEHFVDDDEMKQAILGWRDASPEIVEFWGGQYKWCGPGKWDYKQELFGLEGAAIAAIQNPGQCFHVGDISYGVHNDILFCRLPSGRYLHYHQPRLHQEEDRLRRGPIACITFMGYNSNSTKGPIGWQRMETYGGRLAENVTQAVSADIQGEALKRLEANGYPVVMHTHDEAISEVPEGFGSVEQMCDIMAQRPAWASWWPIRAAGWRHKRYQKD